MCPLERKDLLWDHAQRRDPASGISQCRRVWGLSREEQEDLRSSCRHGLDNDGWEGILGGTNTPRVGELDSGQGTCLVFDSCRHPTESSQPGVITEHRAESRSWPVRVVPKQVSKMLTSLP